MTGTLAAKLGISKSQVSNIFQMEETGHSDDEAKLGISKMQVSRILQMQETLHSEEAASSEEPKAPKDADR